MPKTLSDYEFKGQSDVSGMPDFCGFPDDMMLELLHCLDELHTDLDITQFSIEPNPTREGWAVWFAGKVSGTEQGVYPAMPIPIKYCDEIAAANTRAAYWKTFLEQVTLSYGPAMETAINQAKEAHEAITKGFDE